MLKNAIRGVNRGNARASEYKTVTQNPRKNFLNTFGGYLKGKNESRFRGIHAGCFVLLFLNSWRHILRKADRLHSCMHYFMRFRTIKLVITLFGRTALTDTQKKLQVFWNGNTWACVSKQYVNYQRTKIDKNRLCERNKCNIPAQKMVFKNLAGETHL